MIELPILQRLDVTDYGLFPGSRESRSGLHLTFLPGLTLIVGANGLGKTTLVTILYRMLSGPVDIPGLDNQRQLGNISLRPTALSPSQKSLFAQRVADGARSASARLVFLLGSHQIAVERRLNDLKITRFEIDGEAVAADEQTYTARLCRLIGVWSFGDWILVLRNLMFYFEDRRALVWDASAQRQILRLLFQTRSIAQQWSEFEREILQLDSHARNLRASVSGQEQRLVQNESRIEDAPDVHEELSSLEALQVADLESRGAIDDQFVELDSHRAAARLRFLTADQERESRYRQLERAKLTAIEARFPTRNDSARYILAQLLTESECLVCGSVVPKVAKEMEDRISTHHCVLCGSDVSQSGSHIAHTAVATRRVNRFSRELEAIELEREEALLQANEAEAIYAECVSTKARLDAQIAERSRRIDFLWSIYLPKRPFSISNAQNWQACAPR